MTVRNNRSIRLPKWKKELKRDWQLHLLLLLPLIYVLIFYYGPMYGVQIAFRNFRPRRGILGSEWVGLYWFEKFFTNINFSRVFNNTVLLSLESILIGFPLPIIFALLLNTVRSQKMKKFVQNVSYIPHFISIVVLVSVMNQCLNPINGLYAFFFRATGGKGYPVDIRGLESSFRLLYIGSDIWQNLGWNAIIYMAALGSVSPEHHEAAMIDGASRFKRILHVDLPAILPTMGIMLILRCGQVMNIGFEKAFLMQSPLNLRRSEVIATYIYKVGMGTSSDFSYGAAVGIFNSVINCSLLILVNWLSKVLSHDDVAMF